jgi:hypothetical protein
MGRREGREGDLPAEKEELKGEKERNRELIQVA